ncbi:MAG TPA: hypothetical protein VGI64_13310 [Streptosporangiaceae bacterium]
MLIDLHLQNRARDLRTATSTVRVLPGEQAGRGPWHGHPAAGRLCTRLGFWLVEIGLQLAADGMPKSRASGESAGSPGCR